MYDTQDDILWWDESDSVSDDVSEDIEIDTGDEYYSDALSHGQGLQILEELECQSNLEAFWVTTRVFGWVLEFYILTTSKVTSELVPTCDNAHSWRPYSAVQLGDQATRTMPRYPT